MGNIRQVAGGIAAAFLFAGAGAAVAASRDVPRVAVVQRAPLVVAGSGFGDHERVRLVVRDGELVTRGIRTGTTGRFVVRFPSIRATRCDALSVAVHRRSGTVVRGFVKPLPACGQRAGG